MLGSSAAAEPFSMMCRLAVQWDSATGLAIIEVTSWQKTGRVPPRKQLICSRYCNRNLLLISNQDEKFEQSLCDRFAVYQERESQLGPKRKLQIISSGLDMPSCFDCLGVLDF